LAVAYRSTERTEARRAETRRRIIDAARGLIAEGGYVAAQVAEPVDPAVEAERLHFRHSYRDLMATVIAEGIEAGELPAQDVDATAAALIGAIGEAMVGPLSPTSNGGNPDTVIASLINFCTRAIGEEPARVND
jgi:AcrR family transcriptional regulator